MLMRHEGVASRSLELLILSAAKQTASGSNQLTRTRRSVVGRASVVDAHGLATNLLERRGSSIVAALEHLLVE